MQGGAGLCPEYGGLENLVTGGIQGWKLQAPCEYTMDVAKLLFRRRGHVRFACCTCHGCQLRPW